MATKDKTQEKLYQAAYAAKKYVAGKLVLDTAAEAWPLERNNRGWKYTTAFVADFLLRERDWVLTGEYANASTPMEGYCNKCGETGFATWTQIYCDRGVCSSWSCGGNQMPPEQFMEEVFTERGFELVGAYPTGATRKFWLRHIGGEGVCQQKFETAWKRFYTLGTGCAVCAGAQIVVGYNDFKTAMPKIAVEMLSPDPTTVTKSSHKKAQWCCWVCGNEYESVIQDRSKGHGCPRCSKSGFDPSKPGWLYLLRRYRNGRLEFQWGITNHLEKRTRQYIKYDWVVIDYKYYPSGQQCRDQESELNSMLRKLDAFGVIPPDHKIYMCCTEAFPSGYEIPNPTSVNDLINFNAYWKYTSTERVE